MENRYQKSEELLKRALQTIPLGSQTFSKSITQLPLGISPLFAERGEGAYLYDVDGNKYIDFVNSLMSITLGYNDKDVLNAVKKQLDKGTIFSLATELEMQVAEKICEMVPCAEMVRFGKNGSDATAGAIRIARAYTKKEHVLVCGYHGWQDWYIGSTTRNLGVPTSTQQLTHTFIYNDINSLEILLKELDGQVAAVIMEVTNVTAPKDNFLEQVKELTHKHNAVLIFDETITGFRFAQGGAQEFFNVTPDLATFGKGLANGYPLSAIAGKKHIMKYMEDIFFSFTFGGETLSLAASLATLTKLQNEPVIETINKTGTYLITSLNAKIEAHGLSSIFSVSGYPIWSFLLINDAPFATMWEIKTLLLQEMFANGIFMIGSHNMSYAHTTEHVNALLESYESFFTKVKQAQSDNNLKQFLKCEPLAPLFKVR
jgi:glutamate-1-semialdehyde 2,1-aminomutase